ncbi:hypothetical protein HN011_009277 [Eciton burchellii]|nr:hypothetical protein HN011_009277 [Eciton burchellii]
MILYKNHLDIRYATLGHSCKFQLEILQRYQSKVLGIITNAPGTSHSIMILGYQYQKNYQGILSKILRQIRKPFKQLCCQLYESKKNSEKTREEETYGSIKVIFHS